MALKGLHGRAAVQPFSSSPPILLSMLLRTFPECRNLCENCSPGTTRSEGELSSVRTETEAGGKTGEVALRTGSAHSRARSLSPSRAPDGDSRLAEDSED